MGRCWRGSRRRGTAGLLVPGARRQDECETGEHEEHRRREAARHSVPHSKPRSPSRHPSASSQPTQRRARRRAEAPAAAGVGAPPRSRSRIASSGSPEAIGDPVSRESVRISAFDEGLEGGRDAEEAAGPRRQTGCAPEALRTRGSTRLVPGHLVVRFEREVVRRLSPVAPRVGGRHCAGSPLLCCPKRSRSRSST